MTVGAAVTDTLVGIFGGVLDYGMVATHGVQKVKQNTQHRLEKEAKQQPADNRLTGVQKVTTDVGTMNRPAPAAQERNPQELEIATVSSPDHKFRRGRHLHLHNPGVNTAHPATSIGFANSSIPSVLLERTLGTGFGMGKIIGSIIKFPVLLTLGLSHGFHRVPMLYHDPAVRPIPRVTGFHSGLRGGGTVFAMSMFDAISGIVMLPYLNSRGRNASGKIEGVLTGFLQALAGLIVRPLEGAFALPGYPLAGVGKEVQKFLAKNLIAYVLHTRLEEGNKELLGLEDGDALTKKVQQDWDRFKRTEMVATRYRN